MEEKGRRDGGGIIREKEVTEDHWKKLRNQLHFVEKTCLLVLTLIFKYV